MAKRIALYAASLDPITNGHIDVIERMAPFYDITVVVVALKNMFVLGKARRHWASLMRACGNPARSEEVFHDLVGRYSEPHRAHHTLAHIVSMLDESERVREHLADPTAVAFAVWYHDAVCDPQASGDAKIASDEERSAYVAVQAIEKLGLSQHLGAHVSALILATLHRAPPEAGDAQWVVDLDLAVLGAPEKEFDVYETRIRAEYSFLSPEQFSAGRAKVLRLFLDRHAIYSTAYFRDRYEDAARRNLQRSYE